MEGLPVTTALIRPEGGCDVIPPGGGILVRIALLSEVDLNEAIFGPTSKTKHSYWSPMDEFSNRHGSHVLVFQHLLDPGQDWKKNTAIQVGPTFHGSRMPIKLMFNTLLAVGILPDSYLYIREQLLGRNLFNVLEFIHRGWDDWTRNPSIYWETMEWWHGSEGSDILSANVQGSLGSLGGITPVLERRNHLKPIINTIADLWICEPTKRHLEVGIHNPQNFIEYLLKLMIHETLEPDQESVAYCPFIEMPPYTSRKQACGESLQSQPRPPIFQLLENLRLIQAIKSST